MSISVINIGNRIVNQYLLKINEDIIIIDTGYEGSFHTFIEKYEGLGFTMKQIQFIVITHTHDDHVGFLNDLLDYCDAPVILHKIAMQRLKSGENVFLGGFSTRKAYIIFLLMNFFGRKRHSMTIVDRPDRFHILQDNEKILREYGYEVDLIELPGHTLDSIGVILDHKLFCGDAAMNGFLSTAKHSIIIEDLNLYRDSWKRMIETEVKTIYPSHGKAFSRIDLERNIGFMDNKALIHQSRQHL